MDITQFVTLDEALEMHDQLIKRYGGQSGVRDMGLLQSALARPQSGYYETLTLQAAALFQSLSLNHPFIDGNKRVAFALTFVFLKMNGYLLVASTDDCENFLIEKIIRDKVELEEISRWLGHNIQKI